MRENPPAGVLPAKTYEAHGGARELWRCREPEVLLAGPSGTGKSRGCAEKLNALALKYPGLRALLVRKTRESLTQSGLKTLERDVIVPGQAIWRAKDGEWRYGNGSRLVVGGMDKTSKIMSTEYDVVYVQEATELSEDEWEHLTTRLRGSAMPYSQIIACCNPAGPNHWLKRRAEAGRLVLLESRFEDNPLLCCPGSGAYTEFGRLYLAKLDALTGVRYLRLRKGLWVAAEGIVYDEFDWDVHVMGRKQAVRLFGVRRLPPPSWRRLWAIDFGYTHPFVWQAWAADPDTGTLYRYAELYHTGLLVDEAAARISAWRKKSGERFPEAIICDHDPEAREKLTATWRVSTVAAEKTVQSGIQAVKARLIEQVRSGHRGLVFLAEAWIGGGRDEGLAEAKQPTSTEEEVELYVWREGVKDSEPVKANDHGLDAARYLVAYVDGGKRQWTIEEIMAWGRDDIEELKRLAGGGQPHETSAEEAPGDWHRQWLKDVEERQGEGLRRFVRGG